MNPAITNTREATVMERRVSDEQARVLLQSHHTLVQQIAELAIWQQGAPEEINRIVANAVSTAMGEAFSGKYLTEDEVHWIRASIVAQGKRDARTDAIIEKTLAGFIWAMLVGLGFAVWEYVRNHLAIRQ